METQVKTQKTTAKENSGSSTPVWITLIILIIGATLPFHYVPSRAMVFPKESLTFSNTFISQADIDRLIDRYNNAGLIEKITIRQEPLVKKLLETGVISDSDN